MKPLASMRTGTRTCLAIFCLALAADVAAGAEAPRGNAAAPARTLAVSSPAPAGPTVPPELTDRTNEFGPAREILLTASSQPTGLAATADGALWFSAYSLGALGRLDRATGEISYFPLGTGAKPSTIVEAPDRSILATDRGLNVLHRLNPETGEVTRIAMPADVPFLDLANLKIDVDGRVWFVGASGWLGSHDLASGATDVTSHDDLQGLAYGVATKSTIWFVAGKSGRMIEIDPQRARFNSTALPAGLSGVRGAAAGVKNDVWLSFMKSRAIARFTRRNTWQIASLPWPDSRPQALVVREDGSVVIADAGRRKLVRYQPATNRFDEVGDLGPGGNIKAIVDLGDSIALADMGSDRLLIFPVSAPKAH